MAESLHDTAVENLFFDSCDEEDFPGFDEEDVRQASDHLMEQAKMSTFFLSYRRIVLTLAI